MNLYNATVVTDWELKARPYLKIYNQGKVANVLPMPEFGEKDGCSFSYLDVQAMNGGWPLVIPDTAMVEVCLVDEPKCVDSDKVFTVNIVAGDS